jgi:hypothetical protein
MCILVRAICARGTEVDRRQADGRRFIIDNPTGTA